MRTRLIGAFILFSVFAAAVPALAHHAFAAEFDEKKPIKLQGQVTKMEWINPHSWIHIEVKDPDGKTTNWMIEGGSPNIMLRRGFTKNSLLPGTMIIVEGYLAKNGTNKANGNSITFTDGRKLFVGGSSPTSNGEK
jgi:uncharacterized protein DUF6152